MKLRVGWSVVIIVSLTGLFAAEVPHPKQSWEWTDEERVTALLDDSAAAERLRAARDIETGAATPAGDVIDGRVNPHLFMPWLLFNSMTALAFADDPHTREVYRSSKEEHRQRLGLPADMWERLEVIAMPFLEARRRHTEVARGALPAEQRTAELEAIARIMCRDRYIAIAEAERVFGPEFREFLYTAVAPNSSLTIRRRQDIVAFARVSRGCQ